MLLEFSDRLIPIYCEGQRGGCVKGRQAKKVKRKKGGKKKKKKKAGTKSLRHPLGFLLLPGIN